MLMPIRTITLTQYKTSLRVGFDKPMKSLKKQLCAMTNLAVSLGFLTYDGPDSLLTYLKSTKGKGSLQFYTPPRRNILKKTIITKGD